MTSTPSATSLRTVVLGLIMGLIGTLVAYTSAIGLGFTLYVVFLIGGLLIFARTQKVRPIRRNLTLLAPVLFFAIMLTVRSDDNLTLLNVSALISAALLLVYFFASDNIALQNILAYPAKAVLAGIFVWIQPFTELNNTRKVFGSKNTNWQQVMPVARGLVITMPVVALFIILFSSADDVFARLINNILNFLTPSFSEGLMARLMFFGIFSWTAIGGLAWALLDRKAKRAPSPATDKSDPELVAVAPRLNLGFTETIMLLGSVCLVFAAFVAIQFVYLFGGAANLRNFSYADYLHRGFAELVIVAILTLGLVLILNYVAIRKTRRDTNLFRALSTILVLLTGVILASAFQRLRLYELAYGFTTLRLIIYVFIIWLGILFVGFTLSLYWAPLTINVVSVTALIAVFGFVASLDLINPEAFVTWQNINRGDVDPLYLSTLSEEAVPQLVRLVDADKPGLRAIVRRTLYKHQQRLGYINQRNDWREFNRDRAIAQTALDSVRDRLTGIDPRVSYSTVDIPTLQRVLVKGQTTRQIVGQLGMPFNVVTNSGSGTHRQDEPRQLTLVYSIDNEKYAELSIDTANGLESVCTFALGNKCESLSIKSAS